MEKPYYIIDFSAVNCMIDIRVNDVIILTLNVKGQVSTILPINNAILESGEQQVTYRIMPLIGNINLDNSSGFSASVWLYNADGELVEKENEIISFTLPHDDQETPLPQYKFEDTFYAQVPYTLNAWQNSMNLNRIKNLRELVDFVYKKIERIINNAQYDQFAELIEKRENNMAICMYLSATEKTGRVKELVEIIQSGFRIVPISEKDTMVIYGHGKLVSVKKANGASALLLRSTTKREELNLEIQLHLKEGSNELTVI